MESTHPIFFSTTKPSDSPMIDNPRYTSTPGPEATPDVFDAHRIIWRLDRIQHDINLFTGLNFLTLIVATATLVAVLWS